jgi:anti-sigma factor RsiW
MFECRWTYDVERWFDGEHPEPEAVHGHVETCPSCAGRVARLQRMRAGAQGVAKRHEIGEPQFAAFVKGIRDRVEAPRRGLRGLWALASVTAAALIVAAAAFVVFTSGPEKVNATVVESCTSEIQGATVESYSSANGVTTVWLKVPAAQDDIL